MILMSNKHPKFSLWLSQSSLILATLLIPSGGAIARSISIPQNLLAQSPQLTQVPSDQQIEERIQAEANRVFSRTIAQFNLIILATLALLLAGAIASLWLLRKAVVGEVAHLVSINLQELDTAKSQLNKVTQDLQRMLETAQQKSNSLEHDVENFQQELKQKREIISGLLAEFGSAKQQGLKTIKGEINTYQQTVAKLEAEFKQQLAKLETDTKQQKDLIVENMTRLSSEFTPQLNLMQS